jgi:hypothetical protein
MKKIVLFIFTLLFVAKLFAQTSVVSTSNFTRPVPKVGHMLNYLTKPSWKNQSFIDSVKTLNLEIIRYPGGTESQYFDWQTGKTVPASLWTNGTLFNHAYLGTVPHLAYPLLELLYFYQQTSVKPIFCLNFLTKDLANQLLMLQTAKNLGIPIEYIELGNELYFEDKDFVNKYPNPIDYILDVKNNWLPQIKTAFPNAKIAVIGAYDGATDLNGNTIPNRINTWNTTLFNQNLAANAITFHYYLPPNTTTLSNPNVTQALAAPFRHWQTLKNNTVDNVSNGMECWITEYNLNDGQTNYAIASSWTHGLYTASFFSLMLEEPKIKMLLNHQITGNPTFASLASYTTFGDTLTNRLTAEGNAMRLLHKAIKGKTTATKLNFSVNPNITVNTTVYPSLMGWIFENGTEKELFILNLSNSSFNLDLNAIFENNTFSYEQITATNPLQKNSTTQNLNISKGTTNGSFQSLPYSLVYAKKSSTVTAIDDLNFDKEIVIYPNPNDNYIIISSNSMTFNNNYFKITDILGKDVIKGYLKDDKIDISQLTIGTYILQVEIERGKYMARKIVKR